MTHVDTAKTINHVSLCAGYGGIDLGLKRAIPGLRSVALCEIEAFAIANLVAKMEAGLMDPAPVWTNLKTFPWAEFRGRVDILSGGYPCQPFSSAGKRLGKGDPRHLWPYIADGIDSMRPQICFFENVEGHISLGLPDVIEDLAGLGYRTTWGIFSASEIGAPHQRKRVFILAHRHGERGQLPDWWRLAAEQVPVGDGETRRDVWPSRPGEQQHAWESPRVVGVRQTQPALGRDADGPAGGMDYAELCVSCDNRTDELRLLGNGVVPATAERAFITLTNELNKP